MIKYKEFPKILGLFDLSNYIQEKGKYFTFLSDDNNLIINKKLEQKAKEKFSVNISMLKKDFSIFQDFYFMTIKNGMLPFSVNIKKDELMVNSIVKIVSEINNSFSENSVNINFDIIEIYEIEKLY